MRAEFGANVRNGATQAVVGTWSDLLFALSGRDALAGRLEVEARIRWVDPEFGRFGALSEDFYQFGAQATLRLDGALERPVHRAAPAGPRAAGGLRAHRQAAPHALRARAAG